MLHELFKHQAELNRRIGFDPAEAARELRPQQSGRVDQQLPHGHGQRAGGAARLHLLEALVRGGQGGRRFELHDLQNARVEVIDLLFFWISLAQCVGLDADDVMDLYHQKLRSTTSGRKTATP